MKSLPAHTKSNGILPWKNFNFSFFIIFVFSGSSGKSRDERFLLQEANGTFLQSGYYKAIQAKKDRESKVRFICVQDLL